MLLPGGQRLRCGAVHRFRQGVSAPEDDSELTAAYRFASPVYPRKVKSMVRALTCRLPASLFELTPEEAEVVLTTCEPDLRNTVTGARGVLDQAGKDVTGATAPLGTRPMWTLRTPRTLPRGLVIQVKTKRSRERLSSTCNGLLDPRRLAGNVRGGRKVRLRLAVCPPRVRNACGG